METIFTQIHVIDGSGEPAFVADVGIEGKKLRLLPPNSGAAAAERIDGRGLWLTPGFIDAHAHGDLTLRSAYATDSKISQGITTQIAGQCGVSMYPFTKGDETHNDEFRRYLSGIAPYPELPDDLAACESCGSFLDWLRGIDNPIDTRCFVGLGTLRLWAMGYAARRPTDKELKSMCDMLRRCIREGAMGLSTGLVYAPCCYADNEEILTLLKVVREEGGRYATHPRNEADRVIEAQRESLRLAKAAGVPLCVSHLKAAGHDNWGKVDTCLSDIDRAVDEGQDVLIDCYPYMAGNTSLNVSIPPRYFAKGLTGLVAALCDLTEKERIRREIAVKSDYDNYIYNSGGFGGTLVSSCPVFHDAEGQLLTDYASRVGKDPFDAYCDILIRNGGLGLGIYFHMSEKDVTTIFRHPLTAVSTDGLVGLPRDNPHPRSFGTMPRAYHLMTDEQRLLSPEQAIRRMTGLPAEKLCLTGKGFVREGCDADLCLIDPAAFRDLATYQNGSAHTAGLLRVYARGTLVYKGE